jgi:hypothetical protein
MPNHRCSPVLAFALVFAIGTPAAAAKDVPEVLRRQTQELLDAIATGSAAVWDRYLDEGLRFVPGRPRYRYVFLRGAGGKITGFAQRREAWDLVWKRAAPVPKP